MVRSLDAERSKSNRAFSAASFTYDVYGYSKIICGKLKEPSSVYGDFIRKGSESTISKVVW